MAARTNRVKLSSDWRKRIQTGVLISRLQDNSLGKLTLTPGQLKSTEILLRKVAPDLTSTTLENGDGPLVVELVTFTSPKTSST